MEGELEGGVGGRTCLVGWTIDEREISTGA